MLKIPNPSLKEEGLQPHLIRLGVDYDLFVTLVNKDVAIGTMCNILKKTNASRPWAWETVRGWVRMYKSKEEEKSE